MWETWIRSLDWEDPLENPLQYSGLENPMDYTVHGVAKSSTGLSDFCFHFHFFPSMWSLLWVTEVRHTPNTAEHPCLHPQCCRYLFYYLSASPSALGLHVLQGHSLHESSSTEGRGWFPCLLLWCRLTSFYLNPGPFAQRDIPNGSFVVAQEFPFCSF